MSEQMPEYTTEQWITYLRSLDSVIANRSADEIERLEKALADERFQREVDATNARENIGRLEKEVLLWEREVKRLREALMKASEVDYGDTMAVVYIAREALK